MFVTIAIRKKNQIRQTCDRWLIDANKIYIITEEEIIRKDVFEEMFYAYLIRRYAVSDCLYAYFSSRTVPLTDLYQRQRKYNWTTVIVYIQR